MPITLAVPLDLPDVRVLAHRILENGTVLIEVESTVQTTRCHCCGRDIDRFHGFDRPIRLRHLPVFGRDVVIEIRPKRYPCPHCEGGPTTTQRCAWYDPHRPHTTTFEQDVLKRLTVRWPTPAGNWAWGSKRWKASWTRVWRRRWTGRHFPRWRPWASTRWRCSRAMAMTWR